MGGIHRSSSWAAAARLSVAVVDSVAVDPDTKLVLYQSPSISISIHRLAINLSTHRLTAATRHCGAIGRAQH